MAGVGVVQSKISTFCFLRFWRDRNQGILGKNLHVRVLAASEKKTSKDYLKILLRTSITRKFQAALIYRESRSSTTKGDHFMRITQQLTRGLVLSGATLAISAALIIPSGAATDPILGHDLTSAAGTVTSAGSTFDAPLLATVVSLQRLVLNQGRLVTSSTATLPWATI